MTLEEQLEQDWFDGEVENVRSDFLFIDEEVMLEALIQNAVIDRETGKLTDYWLNLLNPQHGKVMK